MKDILLEAMQYCRNHFVMARTTGNLTFAGHEIKGMYTDIARIGQYILIQSPYLNDEIYQIKTIGDKVITVAEELKEEWLDHATTYFLKIPPAFLRICTSAEKWQADRGQSNGSIASESFGEYSVSYQNKNNEGEAFTWLDQYKASLRPYMRMFNDIPC